MHTTTSNLSRKTAGNGGVKRETDIYLEIVRLRSEGRRSALATIVRRIGSAPRKDHAKMLVRDDGTFVGSVGGGCVEAEVWRLAKTTLQTGRGSMLKYSMTDEDAREEGLVCGGTVEVFVEPIFPDPRVVILGAGHVGQAVAAAAARVGFRIAVIDDRDKFASGERFPDAEEILVRPFGESLDPLRVGAEDFILIVTRGHSHDQVALETAVATPARYVGLVGSRRKIQILVGQLLEKGVPAEAFRNLYAPIGLDIGSETPEEIAVSVAAELIAVRKGVHRRSPKQEFVMGLLQSADPPTPRPEPAVPGGGGGLG